VGWWGGGGGGGRAAAEGVGWGRQLEVEVGGGKRERPPKGMPRGRGFCCGGQVGDGSLWCGMVAHASTVSQTASC
jgi:hypothetical protein